MFPVTLVKYLDSIEARDIFWVPQGGCFSEAKYGVFELGAEINTFVNSFPDQQLWKVEFYCIIQPILICEL